MARQDANRVEGVDFSAIDPVLEDVSYPIAKSAFAEQYGDRTVERTSADPIAVAELFSGTGDDTFESPEEVRQTVLNLMPADSVGRPHYSDRGGKIPDDGLEGYEDDSL
ncbi:hypothetical protein ACKVMT_10680 [Halobacteriales archaeon Cl-PHB]